jgi:transmembrane sensor
MRFLKTKNTNGMSDSILAKYVRGETSPYENTLVEKWMGANDENRKYANGLFMIMEQSNQLGDTGVDEHAAWETLSKKIQQHKNNKAPVRLIYKWMSAAAILLLLAGTLFLLNRNEKPLSYKSAIIKEIYGNGLRTDTLPDGTQIVLDKKSILFYSNDFNNSKRTVQLTGGGYFIVVHNAAKPFTIAVNDLHITDIGTSFIIQSDSNTTAITVQTGAVEITRKNKSIVLGRGEKIFVLKNDTVLQKETAKNIMPAQQQQFPQIPVKKPGSVYLQEDPKKQKVIVRNIISDIVSMRLVNTRDSISWFGLTDKEFIINGQKQKAQIQEVFMEKYHIKKDNGFYYGPVQMIGKGFFITEKELTD